jgi:hypothetical protein
MPMSITESFSESLSESVQQTEENLSSESESEEENISVNNITFNNFKDFSNQEMKDYVYNKIYLKGLNSNTFLIDYFVSAILNNTNGLQIDVDNFLNTNLTTLLNQQRNIQLNSHSFARIRPFLLNNNYDTGFPSLIPYKENLEFKSE